jgi:putative membrane protein
MMDGGWGGGFMFFGGLVFLILLIIAVVYLARIAQTQTRPGPSGPTPMDILKTRYAKGEITKEEFDRMKHDLGG